MNHQNDDPGLLTVEGPAGILPILRSRGSPLSLADEELSRHRSRLKPYNEIADFLACKELCWSRTCKEIYWSRSCCRITPREIGSIPPASQAAKGGIMVHPPFMPGKDRYGHLLRICTKVLPPGNRKNGGKGEYLISGKEVQYKDEYRNRNRYHNNGNRIDMDRPFILALVVVDQPGRGDQPASCFFCHTY